MLEIEVAHAEAHLVHWFVAGHEADGVPSSVFRPPIS
jgi:hypothetical protein